MPYLLELKGRSRGVRERVVVARDERLLAVETNTETETACCYMLLQGEGGGEHETKKCTEHRGQKERKIMVACRGGPARAHPVGRRRPQGDGEGRMQIRESYLASPKARVFANGGEVGSSRRDAPGSSGCAK